MGIKSFFQKIFGIDPNHKSAKEGSQAKFLNGGSSSYAPYSGEFYANSLVRSIVHKIAAYCSMISFEHCRGYGDNFEKVSSPINRLLTVKPNDYMTPSELLYKHITDLLIRNNAYIWIKRDREGNPTALLPVIANSVEMREIDGLLFYRFSFASGDKLTVYSGDIIHNRQYFYLSDWFGTENDPLRNSVGMLESMQVSVDSALKNSAQIRGILKHQNTIDIEDLERHEKLFRENYLNPSNNGGIGMIDAKFDFIPVNFSGKITDAEQMKEIRDYVYRYFNINDEIMMSNYSSDKWQSFHEGKVAPILNNMTQAFNIHLFTDKELGFGNRIVSSVNSITFMSPQQRISMVKLSLDGALYNRNEIRQWFGDGPIPGGDTYQFSKNFTEETDPNNIKKEDEEDATSNETGSETN